MKFKFKNRQVQTMYDLMELTLKKSYTEYCKGHYHDDRRIFINTYRQLVRLLLTSDKVYGQSVLLDVAIHDKFGMELQNLKKIQGRFTELAKV